MSTICWHVHGRWCPESPERTESPESHRCYKHIDYGRCRAGRRWFWHACTSSDRTGLHGWSDSEDQAIEAARNAVVQLADGQQSVATLRHDVAYRGLKKINANKRHSRPPPAAENVEYLYSWGRFARFRIIRRAKQRIFYVRDGELINRHGEPLAPNRWVDGEVGFIDRQLLEAYGQVRSATGDYLFASLEGMLDDYDRLARSHNDRLARSNFAARPDLVALKAAMIRAHPDKGGTSAAFIKARQRYVDARRVVRGMRVSETAS